MGCGPVTPAQMLSPCHYRSPPRSGSGAVRPLYQQCLFVPNHAHGTFSFKPTTLLPLYGPDKEMQRFQDMISEGAYYHVSPENAPSLSFISFICNTQTQAHKSSPSAVYGFLETAAPTRFTIDMDIKESLVLTGISVYQLSYGKPGYPMVSLYVVLFKIADSKNPSSTLSEDFTVITTS